MSYDPNRPTRYEDLLDLPAEQLQFLYIESQTIVSDLDKRLNREYRRKKPLLKLISDLTTRLSFERDLRDTYKLFWDTARDVIVSDHGTETELSGRTSATVSSRNLSVTELSQLRGNVDKVTSVAPQVANVPLSELFAGLDDDTSSGAGSDKTVPH